MSLEGPCTPGRSAILLLVAALAGCFERPAPDDPLVATYAGGEVRQSDLDAWRSFLGRERRDGGRIGLDTLERHVVMRTLAAEAVALGLEDEATTRLRIRRAVDERLGGMLHDAVLGSIAVSEGEIADYLRAHRAELEKPERRVVSFIFRRTEPGQEDVVRRDLEAVRRRLLAGGDFATLAAEASDSPSRFRGGRLGTVRQGQLPAALDRALFTLQRGELTEVLATGAGLALLRCDDILPAYTMESLEARRRIVSHLRRPLFETAWADLVERLTAGRIEQDLGVLRDPAADADAVVSRFGDDTLTRAEAELFLDPELVGDPAATDDLAGILQRFAHNSLLAAEARRRRLHEEPERVRELTWVRLEELARVLLRRKVDPLMPEATEALLRQHYGERAEAYRLPGRYHLRVARRPYATGGPAEAYRAFAALVEGVRDGSLSLEEVTGAETRWYARSEVVGWGPILLRAVDDLEPGEVTDPIQEAEQMWVVELVEREPGRRRDFEEVRSAVATGFARAHRQRLIRQVLHWTLASARLERQEPVGYGSAANENGED
jgi:parvulin-like peptidyl-prolyl isomerase